MNFPPAIPARPGTPDNVAGVSGSSSATASGRLAAERRILPNGLVVLMQRNDATPTVSIRGEIRVGAVQEPAELAGLATYTAMALIRGTRNHTFQELVGTTEERGSSISAGGGQHVTGFVGKCLQEDQALILELLAEVLRYPTFPADEIEKLRGQFLMSLREYEQDTRALASRALRALLYPAVHPYSRLTVGTSETVQRISRDDLRRFQQLYHPARTTIAIVGAIEPETTFGLLEQFFGDWEPATPPPAQPLPPVPALHTSQRRDITVPGKVQTDVLLAVHGLKRSDPDYYAATLANMVLGQFGMGGRLWENVRDKQGMAYSVASNLEAGIGAGAWIAYAGVNPANVERAIEALLHEIERFRQDGPTDEELNDVRSYLTGSLVLGLETNSGMAGTLLAIERHSLGLDYIARYPAIIQGVTSEAVLEAARRYLSTERYVLAVAGPEV